MSSSQESRPNIDPKVVDGFGTEWSRFSQDNLEPEELKAQFEAYFGIFPFDDLPKNAEGFDLGCGSGRWAREVAAKVKILHCIDASGAALDVAKRNLKSASNCVFYHASVDSIPLQDASMDFGYSLGVLHHVPDTRAGVDVCIRKLKRGAPFLIYLYYAFDNRPAWFRAVWKASNILREGISRSPAALRNLACDTIALTVYYPLARFSGLAERVGFNVNNVPLSAYRGSSFYTMRTDALDRFGTRLEQRFTRAQIEQILKDCGLAEIQFSDSAPFWVAVGKKA